MEVSSHISNSMREGSPWRIAARRFAANRLSFISLIFIVLVAIMAILAYVISPDASPNANNQHLEISTLQPGSRVSFILISKANGYTRHSWLQRLFIGKPSQYKEIPIASYAFSGHFLTYTEHVGMGDTTRITHSISLAAILFPGHEAECKNDSIFLKNSSEKISVAAARKTIEEKHIVTRRFWLGTDRFGRDLLSRLVIGSRVSLSVGFIAVTISLFIGITLGATAGFFRGFYDDLIMWLINVVWSIPTLLMVIALTMVIGKGFWQIFVAVGLTMWVEVARVVRGQVLSLREKEFIEAARVMGFSSWRIIIRHILPNILGPVIVISASNFATAILLESGLSFLGIGVQPPAPSWGTMIKDHYGYIIMDKAHLAILPGLAIMLLVLAFTFIGNGLRDALDPKTENL